METSKEDWKQAVEFYNKIRSHDGRILELEERAITYVFQLTGYKAEDVGSFGLKLNLPDSDLDLAIGVPAADSDRVLSALRMHMKYKGERTTRDSSTRHVFALSIDGVEIDLGVLPDDDFSLLCESLERCRREMTHEERIEHVWQKNTLKKEGRRLEYATLKLLPYARFCPTFRWVPILDGDPSTA
jgi:hypothetical protein